MNDWIIGKLSMTYTLNFYGVYIYRPQKSFQNCFYLTDLASSGHLNEHLLAYTNLHTERLN